MSFLRGGIHGGTLSRVGCEKCKMDVRRGVTDRILSILSSRRGWGAERLAHRDKEAGRGGPDAGMCGGDGRVVRAGGIDVRRG